MGTGWEDRAQGAVCPGAGRAEVTPPSVTATCDQQPGLLEVITVKFHSAPSPSASSPKAGMKNRRQPGRAAPPVSVSSTKPTKVVGSVPSRGTFKNPATMHE